MGHLKIFTIALVIMVGNTFFPELKPRYTSNKSTTSYEIVKVLEDHTLILEKEIRAEVKFSLNSDREITIHSITTEDEEVKKFISEKLQDQKLLNEKWCVGKRYSLPVKIEITR